MKTFSGAVVVWSRKLAVQLPARFSQYRENAGDGVNGPRLGSGLGLAFSAASVSNENRATALVANKIAETVSAAEADFRN